ncbi:MAG TPA: PDZ domain-containing protein [Nitrospira sp.]|jgi:C-terminal processing protease CtpA/Prc|nr:PDZ domain-containing protein [Nitrospira sp.]
MRITAFHIAAGLIMGLLMTGSAMADQHKSQAPYGRGDTKLSTGIIGISLQVGAERIGDPAILYVGMVHPEGPAHQAGLGHGDEVVSVDGTPVKGKRYEEVVGMIRGEVGTAVKVGVKGENGLRELSITRVADDKLSRGPSGSHGNPAP